MVLYNILKELKKRLRRKRRRWLILGFWIIFVVVSLSSISKLSGYRGLIFQKINSPYHWTEDRQAFTQNMVSEPIEPHDEIIERIKNETTKRPVVMVTQYICGEESKQMGNLDSKSILKIHEDHPQAHITIDEDGMVVFTKLVNDLSPQCKDNAYFGVDASGNLTLFEGPPEENNVIRTFFQLNVRYLESRLETVQQLVQGIRVTDLSEYFSVLSTFSDFAVDETEKVMRQQL